MMLRMLLRRRKVGVWKSEACACNNKLWNEMWCKWGRRKGMYNRYARTRGCATINLISCLHNLRNIFSVSLKAAFDHYCCVKKKEIEEFPRQCLKCFFRDIVTYNRMCAIEITLKLVNNFSIFVQIDLTTRVCCANAKALIDSINQFLKFSLSQRHQCQ